MRDRLQPLWVAADEANGHPVGVHTFRISSGEVHHACGDCDAFFPQNEDGWRDLRAHQFEMHEKSVRYDWAELDGLDVRLSLVRRPEAPDYFSPQEGHVRVDLIATAADGTVYTFPFNGYEDEDRYHGTGKLGHFKIKPRAKTRSLLGTGVIPNTRS